MSDKQIIVEPVYAWKVWRVITAIEEERWVYGKYTLISPLYMYVRWPYRVAMAADRVCWLNSDSKIIEVPHAIPYFYCECGIHAFKCEQDAVKYLQRERKFAVQWQVTFSHIKGSSQEKPRECFAIGKISLWGNVIEHEQGYRAQYAYPYDIELIGGTKEMADNLREQYQIDVKLENV